MDAHEMEKKRKRILQDWLNAVDEFAGSKLFVPLLQTTIRTLDDLYALEKDRDSGSRFHSRILSVGRSVASHSRPEDREKILLSVPSANRDDSYLGAFLGAKTYLLMRCREDKLFPAGDDSLTVSEKFESALSQRRFDLGITPQLG